MADAAKRRHAEVAIKVPKEPLEMILASLGLADHVRFGSVCKWWRSVAAENQLSAANKPLSLVRSKNPRRLLRRLLITLPWFIQIRFIGSVHGWLVLETDGRRMFLFNPAAPPAIPLPPLLPHPDSHQKPCKVVLSSPPSSSSTSTCRIVLWDGHGRLAFCRPGDTAWTLLSQKPQVPTRDIIFFQEQLYLIDSKGRIQVFDSELNPNPFDLNPGLPLGDGFYCLVNAFDKLLAIMTFDRFQVFEIDPDNWTCTRVQNFGGGDDNIAFLSDFGSLIVPAKDYPEFLPNHAYKVTETAQFICYTFNQKARRGRNRWLLFFTLFSNLGLKELRYMNQVERQWLDGKIGI